MRIDNPSSGGGEVIGCELLRVGNQAIAVTVQTPVNWNTVNRNDGDLFDALNPTKITVVEEGWYQITAKTVIFPGTFIQLTIWKNPTIAGGLVTTSVQTVNDLATIANGSGSIAQMATSALVYLVAGDVIVVTGTTDTGAGANILSARMGMKKV
jgi:hypothetical protein